MIVRTARELPRSAPLGRHHEDVRVAVLEVTAAVRAVPQLVDDDRRSGPLRTVRLRRHLGEGRRGLRHEHRHRDPVAVRRPCDTARRLGDVRELGRLSRVHPTQEDLSRAVFGPYVQQTVSVRGPTRGADPVRSVRERPVIGPVGVDHPKGRTAPIGHDIEATAHVDDARAVRRDPGIGCDLHLEYVQILETIGI